MRWIRERERLPHVALVAPVETEEAWDGASSCALLKEFRDTMTSDGGMTITNTILPGAFPTSISISENKIKGRAHKDREGGGGRSTAFLCGNAHQEH